MYTTFLAASEGFLSIKEYVAHMAKYYKEPIPALSRYLEVFQFFGQELKPIGDEAQIRFMKEIKHAELDHEFHNAYMNALFNFHLVVMPGFKRMKDGTISACWFNGVHSGIQGPNCVSAFNAPAHNGLIVEAVDYYGFIMDTAFITKYKHLCTTTLQLILWYLKVYGPMLPFFPDMEINPEDGFPIKDEQILRDNPSMVLSLIHI